MKFYKRLAEAESSAGYWITLRTSYLKNTRRWYIRIVLQLPIKAMIECEVCNHEAQPLIPEPHRFALSVRLLGWRPMVQWAWIPIPLTKPMVFVGR